jgi:hypothetical protein
VDPSPETQEIFAGIRSDKASHAHDVPENRFETKSQDGYWWSGSAAMTTTPLPMRNEVRQKTKKVRWLAGSRHSLEQEKSPAVKRGSEVEVE